MPGSRRDRGVQRALHLGAGRVAAGVHDPVARGGRPRGSASASRPALRSNSAPQPRSARAPAPGPRSTSTRTAAGSHSPTPATSVSASVLRPGVSAGSSAAAMPPWAQRVEPSSTFDLGDHGDVQAGLAQRAARRSARRRRSRPRRRRWCRVQPGSGAARRRGRRGTVTPVPASAARCRSAGWRRPGPRRAAGRGRPRAPVRGRRRAGPGSRRRSRAAPRSAALSTAPAPLGPSSAPARSARDSASACCRCSGGEVAVAAGQREPVRVPYGRGADDLDAELQVGHDPADQRELLVVLLAEHGDVRADQAEQLGHHGQHAGEVAGPARALEQAAERAGVDA